MTNIKYSLVCESGTYRTEISVYIPALQKWVIIHRKGNFISHTVAAIYSQGFMDGCTNKLLLDE